MMISTRSTLIALVAGFSLLSSGIAQEQQLDLELDHDAPVAEPYNTLGSLFTSGGAYLGAVIDEVDAETTDRLGLTEERGALIKEVKKGTPAEQAGIRDNDVIVGWNGTRVESAIQLRRHLRETPAGRTVRIDLIRDGESVTLDLKVGKRPESTFGGNFGQLGEMFGQGNMLGQIIPPQDGDQQGWNFFGEDSPFASLTPFDLNRRAGMTLQPLSPQLAKYFGVERGALVSEVRENTAAMTAGLQAGDVIVQIGGKKIDNTGELELIMQSMEGPVTLRIVRDKREMEVTIELEKRHGEMENPWIEEIDPNFGDALRDFGGTLESFKEGDVHIFRFRGTIPQMPQLTLPPSWNEIPKMIVPDESDGIEL